MHRQPAQYLKKSLHIPFGLGILFFMALFAMAIEAYAEIPLQIQETLGIDRSDEMVHNGIPVALEDQWFSVSNLIVEDSSGTQVPATFEVLSRWAGGKDDTSKPIQWLLVAFPASVSANGTANFYIRQGTPVSPNTRVVVNEAADNYTIDTGAAQFVINKNSLTLFDAISREGGQLTSGNGGSQSKIRNSAEVPGQSATQPSASANPPQITFERQNDHCVVIKAEGNYANTPLGFFDSNNNADHTKPLSYKIRYEFYAGSPTVTVYHKFYWSGVNTYYYNWDDELDTTNSRQIYISMGLPIIVENVSMTLPGLSGCNATEVYADASTMLSGSLTGSQSASVAQRLREPFDSPHVAEVNLGSDSTSTQFATRPMLINRSANGALAVSIDHMEYFEPQSIRTDAQGRITVNVMDGNQYFSSFQGAWARVGISALPADATYADTLQKNYAPLNQRLFAFPTNAYTAASKVLLEVLLTPNGSSDQQLQKYYTEMKEITDFSREFKEDEGFRGLMTWGSLPRYLSETGSGTGWDKIYSGARLTDYHSGWYNVVHQFLLEGDPQHLYDLSFPGARRMLHTQILQPDAERSESYMGWAPCGYQRYREQINSSHSYFENLYNYYYMTGDMEVIDILQVSGETTRQWYTRESNGDLNDQDSGGESYVNHAGRAGCQIGLIYNFLGHTYDAGFLNDWRHMFNHVFSRSVLLLDNNGTEYGFLSYDELDGSSPVQTNQFWMSALYTMHNLYTFYNEYGDVALGSSNLEVSRVFEGLANTYKDYVPTICIGDVDSDSCGGRTGDGTWNGSWSNAAMVDYSGNKVGGTLTEVTSYYGSDPVLYVPEKSMLASVMLRAGQMTGNSDLTSFALEGVDWTINVSMVGRDNSFAEDNGGDRNGASTDTWSKVNAMLFARLRHAMAYIEDSFGIVTTTLPDATIGTSYSRTLSASGGTAPYLNWVIISGSLPNSLVLNQDSAEISGTPSTEGAFTFTVQVSDSASPNVTASRALHITVLSAQQDDDGDDTDSGGTDDAQGNGGSGSGGCFIQTSISNKFGR